MIGNVFMQLDGDLRRSLVEAHEDSPLRVNPDRVRAVLELLDVLPDAVPVPEVRIGIDGELALLWQQDAKTLGVIVEATGWLRFGAEFGRERREDRVPFIYPKLPDIVREILQAFVRCDA